MIFDKMRMCLWSTKGGRSAFNLDFGVGRRSKQPSLWPRDETPPEAAVISPRDDSSWQLRWGSQRTTRTPPTPPILWKPPAAAIYGVTSADSTRAASSLPHPQLPLTRGLMTYKLCVGLATRLCRGFIATPIALYARGWKPVVFWSRNPCTTPCIPLRYFFLLARFDLSMSRHFPLKYIILQIGNSS